MKPGRSFLEWIKERGAGKVLKLLVGLTWAGGVFFLFYLVASAILRGEERVESLIPLTLFLALALLVIAIFTGVVVTGKKPTEIVGLGKQKLIKIFKNRRLRHLLFASIFLINGAILSTTALHTVGWIKLAGIWQLVVYVGSLETFPIFVLLILVLGFGNIFLAIVSDKRYNLEE